jgi:hypothetical protein
VKCEKYVKGKKRCDAPASAFVMGVHLCAVHLPPPQPKCSHSLAPSGRCAFCGQQVPS